MIKQDAIEFINGLPDDVSWDDLLYHLYVHKKIEHGKEAARDGKMFTAEDARRMLRREKKSLFPDFGISTDGFVFDREEANER